jgi:glycosyltransferase involved in cell wall biosynthesis
VRSARPEELAPGPASGEASPERGDPPVVHRLAFVSDAVYPFNKGGKEMRLHELTTRLARSAAFDVHVYTMHWWDGPRTIHMDGVWFHAISKRHPLYSGNRRSTRQAVLFGIATLRLIREKFDVLDVDHMPFFPLFSARVVCWIRRKPLIGTWHEVWGGAYWSSYMGRLGVIGRVTELAAVRVPDLIVANSAQTAERLRSCAPGVSVVTVPLGIDLARIDAIPAASRRSDVVYAGRLLPNKNIGVLLDAIGMLRESRPDISCLIVGEGPERPSLEARAVELGIDGNVSFENFYPEHDELLGELKAAKVFAFPSQREGFGLVLLEANACGLPVVTCRHPDNAARHLIVEGENGFVVGGDAASLAAGIARALDPEHDAPDRASVRARLGDYDWANVAGRVGAILAGASRRGVRRYPVNVD